MKTVYNVSAIISKEPIPRSTTCYKTSARLFSFILVDTSELLVYLGLALGVRVMLKARVRNTCFDIQSENHARVTR